MRTTILVHLPNDDPILAEIEELPQPADNFIQIFNPRKRDGKPLHFIANEAVSVIFPWHRITFIEVMGSESNRAEVVEFFREKR